jgi:hypothetical protein
MQKFCINILDETPVLPHYMVITLWVPGLPEFTGVFPKRSIG